MRKMEKIVNVLIVLVLIISNCMVGSPLRYNIEYGCIIINIIAIFYLAIIVYKKEKIGFNIIDLIVILFAFTTFIPLFAKSYMRLSDTVEYIIRYLSALNMYFIVKYYLKQDRKRIDVIVNIIILMTVIVILFGIDMMTFKAFNVVYEFIKIPKMTSESKERIVSLFKYANTFCVYSGIGLFITINEYLDKKNNREQEKKGSNEKWHKIRRTLYTNAVFMQLFAIMATFSRLGWIIILGLLFLNFICLKGKRKQFIRLIIFSGINAFVFFCVFNKELNGGSNIIIYLLLVIQNIIQFVMFYKSDIIYKVYEKTNKKLAIISVFSIIGIIVGILYISAPNELVLFNSESNPKSYKRQNILVDGDKIYNLQIDMKAESNQKDNFKIEVRQYNDMDDIISQEDYQIDKLDRVVNFSTRTEKQTKMLELVFKSVKQNSKTKMIIRSVKLNDKEIKVYYKLIPITLINRIERIKLDAASVNTRGAYFDAAVKLIKENPICGYGGNAWKYQDFDDITLMSVAEHSYPLQLCIQNGVMALVFYIVLVVFVFVKGIQIYKNNEKYSTELGFWIAILLIMLHSILDFDMYFQIIILDMFIALGILNDNKVIEIKHTKAVAIICEILLVVLLYFNIGEAIGANFDLSKIEDDDKKIEIIDARITIFPYKGKYYKNKRDLLMRMRSNSLKKIEDIDEDIEECENFLRYIEKYPIL